MKGPLFDWEGMRMKELIPGYHAKICHADRMTFVLWEIEKDAVLPEHKHEHEQVFQLYEGIFELMIAGKKYDVRPGQIIRIPANTMHSGKAIIWCKALDTFSPVRDDYQNIEEAHIL